MGDEHCGRCGYLVEYHNVARRCPGMKTGTWKQRDPIDGALWPEILARDVAARMRAMEESRRPYVVEVIPPPIVTARPPQGPHEFAHTKGKQAVGLGRSAARAGMDVAPYYWKSGTGIEGCAVKGHRPTLAFVATWERKPGASWAFATAYAWNPSDGMKGPIKVNSGQLLSLLK